METRPTVLIYRKDTYVVSTRTVSLVTTLKNTTVNNYITKFVTY